MFKLNVCQGVCSSVRLDTDMFIGTIVLNCQTLKTLFLQILVFKMIFSRKLGGIYFFSSTSGKKYKLVWSDITALAVTLSASFLVKAKNIPQNAHYKLFIWSKAAFVQDNLILNMAKVFKIWHFFNIEICENTLNCQEFVTTQKCPLET